MPYKLGKLAPKTNPKTLLFSNYVAALPDPPKKVWREYKIPANKWGMYRNDLIGDCTCAAIAHMLMLITAHTGQVIIPTEDEVVAAYSAISGYDPNTGINDNGAAITDVLDYWRTTGIAGHKILGWAQINQNDIKAIKQAIWLFGGIDVGVTMPASAMDQSNNNKSWQIVNDDGGIVGGHSIPNFGYGSQGTNCITWAMRQPMSWDWFAKYCVSPRTRILTADLHWVLQGDIKPGDELLAFDENARSIRSPRRFRKTKVESLEFIKRPCYDLTFDDGTEVRCSSEHQWLKRSSNGLAWAKTEDLRFGLGGTGSTHVLKPLEVWKTEINREGGYLAAAFDGEGSLSQKSMTETTTGSIAMSYSQRPNSMCEEVIKHLQRFGFKFNVRITKDLEKKKVLLTDREKVVQVEKKLDSCSAKEMVSIELSTKREILRFLGSIRPIRLLSKFNPDIIGALYGKPSETLLVKKEYVGLQEVVAMKTDAHTFFAEGLASHNCDEAYIVLTQDWVDQKTGKTPGGFDMATLQKDLNALKV